MSGAKRYNLTPDGNSWVDVYQITPLSQEEFENLWDIHPKDYDTVIMMGKPTKTPRWTQSYGQAYKFAGTHHEALPIPPVVQKYLDMANNTSYATDFPVPFNMALLNWYENGLHYIGPHSDDESQMAKRNTNETVVFSISFGEKRKFRFTPKKNTPDGVKLDIDMISGTVVVMGGTTQLTHKHSVPKVVGKKGQNMGKRINLTFRTFKA